VQGVAGYKPANSDAGGDLYLMDYIGMFGVSLVPVSQYPENSSVIFLPTQAAADRDIVPKIISSLDKGAKIILTTGFLVNANGNEQLARMAGVKLSTNTLRNNHQFILNNGHTEKLKFPLTTEYQIVPDGSRVLLQTSDNQPFLVQNKNLYLINTHTFSQQDFDAVGEVLLCPRQIGLLELPRSWMNMIRSAFHPKDEPVLDAPSRVSIQTLSDHSFVIHNYNQERTVVNITLPESGVFSDGFSHRPIPVNGKGIRLEMEPRSRIWVRREGC